MGMTMTQKILAAHAGLDSVTAGQLIEAKLDVVMANDITGPMALPIFRQMADKVFDKDKVVLVPDHFTPNKDIKSAENSKAIREFAKDQGLSWYFEQGKSGVEHAILPEAGVVAAGECIIGADSHTCTPTMANKNYGILIDGKFYDDIVNEWISHYLYGVENGAEKMPEVLAKKSQETNCQRIQKIFVRSYNNV